MITNSSVEMLLYAMAGRGPRPPATSLSMKAFRRLAAEGMRYWPSLAPHLSAALDKFEEEASLPTDSPRMVWPHELGRDGSAIYSPATKRVHLSFGY